MQPAYPETSTQLTTATFPQLAEMALPPDAQEILLLCCANEIPPTFREKLDNPETLAKRVKGSVEEATDSEATITHCTTKSRKDLPYPPDAFDYTIHVAINNQVLQMHKPLYESSRVTRRSGKILYYNTRSIPDADTIEKEEISILNWESHDEPTLAAEMRVINSGGHTQSNTAQRSLTGGQINNE